MATAVRLVMTFNCEDGKAHGFGYNYAKSTGIGSDTVGSVMETIITNGSIFENVPVSKKSAKLVVTNTTEFEV